MISPDSSLLSPLSCGQLEKISEDHVKYTLNEVVVEACIENMVEADADAIVNAANGNLQLGGGVAGAIRGKDIEGIIQKTCDQIIQQRGPLKDGEAVATPGWKKGQWVVHAVGPVYAKGRHDQCVQRLHDAYVNAFSEADRVGVESVAVPFLSSGIFGFTAEKGSAKIALRAVQDYLNAGKPAHLKRIRFVSLERDGEIRHAFIKAIEEACK